MQEWERESPRQPQPTPQGAPELGLLFRLVLRGARCWTSISPRVWANLGRACVTLGHVALFSGGNCYHSVRNNY